MKNAADAARQGRAAVPSRVSVAGSGTEKEKTYGSIEKLTGLIMTQGQRSVCVVVGITTLSLWMYARDCQFSVLAASRSLALVALSPTSGSVGTEVAVTGYGFTPSHNAIRFGAGYINGLNSADGVTLRFTVPEGQNLCPPTDAHSPAVVPCPGAYPRVTPGSYSISVLNTNGTSNSLTFTVIGK